MCPGDETCLSTDRLRATIPRSCAVENLPASARPRQATQTSCAVSPVTTTSIPLFAAISAGVTPRMTTSCERAVAASRRTRAASLAIALTTAAGILKSCAFTAANSPLTARNCCCKSAAEGPATSPAPGAGRGGGGSTGSEAGGCGCGASFKNFAMTPCMPGSAARFTVPGATASSATQTCVSACSVCTCGARLVRRDSNTAQPATGHTTGSTLRGTRAAPS